MRGTALLISAVLLTAACGSGTDGPRISNARIGAPTGANAALYLTASENAEPDRLLSVSTPVAVAVQMHESTVEEDGVVGMHPVDGLDLDGTLVLEPGGYHLMLIDVQRLEVGETVEVTLRWEKAGEMTIDAEVVAPGEVMGNGG